ncbi:MAG: DNA repair protein RecN, partial [Bryobacteraceae bacterium]|nr:DNA repair protein RecN [Bryobacteraceae bacterium]
MLVELIVENYAVIDRLRIRFHHGFNVLTGETGSGKSIVVDALGLLFGGRASAEMVRTGSERARISGIFEVPADAALRALLEQAGISAEDGELLLEREILPNGKSRAFAGSRMVTVSLLKEIAPFLGDIHGQHDQQLLFDKTAQLGVLDDFARASDALTETANAFAQWKQARAELDELDHTEQERLRMADLWAHQVKEIDSLALKPGEDESLEADRRRLQNATKLEESASGAYEALYDSPQSALAQMRAARRRIEELGRYDAATAGPLLESMRTAEIALDETSLALRDYRNELEADPGRLDQIETRLAAMDRLKRKYGGTIEEILAFLETTRRSLESATNVESRREELKAKLEGAASAYREAAAKLSAARRESAPKLEKKIETELGTLAMERTRFRVAFSEAGWTARGFDAIEFLFSANAGEEPKALDRIASGGELSRVALALKTCVAVAGRAPKGVARTMVFDEVDAGIGGRAAETVGRRLKQLAVANQVLCVTHLAQIAGFGDHH